MMYRKIAREVQHRVFYIVDLYQFFIYSFIQKIKVITVQPL